MTPALPLALLVLAAQGTAPAPAPTPATAPTTPAPAATSAGPRLLLDRVAATVNGDVVTLVDLVRKAGPAYDQALAMPAGPERQRALAEVLRRAFDQVVADRLFAAKAKELDLEITDQQVDAQLEDIKKRNSFTDAQFAQALQSEGLDLATFRAQVRAQLQNYALLQYQIGSKVKITDEDLRNYFQSHPQEFEGEDEVHLLHIFLPIPPGAAGEARALDDGRRVLQRLKTGEDFGKVAKEVSRGPAADEGGDLGWIRHGTLDHALEDPAFALKTGQLSDLIRFGPGYHILKVEERRKGNARSFEQVKDEIRARLLDEQGETYRKQYVAELRRDALIEVKIPELAER